MWSARRSLAAIMLELVAIERHADAWPCRYENVKVPVDQGFGDDFVSKPDASDELGAERDTALGRCDLQAGRRADRAFKESTAIARNASGLGNSGDLTARSQDRKRTRLKSSH